MDNADKGGLFGTAAQRYDSTVELVAPYYRTMHTMLLELAVEALGFADPSGLKPVLALDVGSGTGAEAIPLLGKVPQMQLVGVDRSGAMNDVFKERAVQAKVGASRFHLIEADVLESTTATKISRTAEQAFNRKGFQIALSAFTLHHFDKFHKKQAIELIYELLEPGGVFLLGDLFDYSLESDWLSTTISDWETRWLGGNFERCANTAKETGDAKSDDELRQLREKWIRHYKEENVLDSVTTHDELLRAAGFTQVGNPFRYWQVGLLFAKK